MYNNIIYQITILLHHLQYNNRLGTLFTIIGEMAFTRALETR